MLGKAIPLAVFLLLCARVGHTQAILKDPSAPPPPHPAPPCPYEDSFCVWGQVFNATGSGGPGDNPLPLMFRGPIDVCYGWDLNCLSPVQSVCQLHGYPRGHPRHHPGEASYWFVLRTDTTWIIKPRVTGSHQSWSPSSATIDAGSVSSGQRILLNFILTGGYPGSNTCDF